MPWRALRALRHFHLACTRPAAAGRPLGVSLRAAPESMGARRAPPLQAVLFWVLRHLVSLDALKALPRAARAAARAGAAPLRRRPAKAANQPVAVADAPTKPAPAGAGADTPTKPAPRGSPPSGLQGTAGAALFGGLLFLAGAQPAWLPAAFLVFCATGLPWRVYHYTRIKPRNRMFLLDFCYLTSALAAAVLLIPAARRHAGLVGAVYALSDGPVGSALLAWQCAWVFHSAEHTISVLLHILPGLAMAAHHHLRLHDTATLPVPPLAGIGQGSAWLLGAPLAFYLAWQAAYFVLVQVAARPLIQAQGLDTSYRCLTRRARRARNVWARLVLRGSTARRLAVYGAVQLGYTAGTLLLFLPTYYFPALAFAWQAVKFLAPVFFGFQKQASQLRQAAADHA